MSETIKDGQARGTAVAALTIAQAVADVLPDDQREKLAGAFSEMLSEYKPTLGDESARKEFSTCIEDTIQVLRRARLADSDN